jgi:hypothetical protein
MTLGEAPLETAPAEASAKTIGRIETDMFCPQCHYNLHGLDVRLDPRLDIAIIRCPECGKFSPAGIATGAGRIWLHRLATFLITLWIGTIVLAIAGGTFFTFILDMIGFDGFLHFEYQNPVGGPHGFRYIHRPSTAADFHSFEAFFLAHSLLVTACILLGWLLGSFLSVFLWHIRKRFHLWTLILPIAAAILAWKLYFEDFKRFSSDTPAWASSMACWMACWQLLGLLAGISLGRPIARLLLRALLTKRLVHYVRYLWEIDGKSPPDNVAPKHQ